MKLYHYWRSTSSWRVRWAFALKGIECEMIQVNLLNGESESPEHLARNPMGYVPVLEIPGKGFLAESMAIMEWAEETKPTPSLLPGNAWEKARIRQLAEVINAGTQPLQNLGAQYLYSEDPEKRKYWAQHWIREGLNAYETLAKSHAGKFSLGDTLTLADLCLVPQLYNANRYELSLSQWPTLERIWNNAQSAPGFAESEPSRYQP